MGVCSMRQRGLTLVELMTVVATLAIFASVAAPGLSGFLAGQRVKALTYDLTADLLLARNEALKRGLDVTLTPGGAGWKEGWSMSVGGLELSARSGASASVAVAGAPSAIVFDRNGRVASPTSAVRITVSTSALSDSSAARCVQLDLSGRARSQTGACV